MVQRKYFFLNHASFSQDFFYSAPIFRIFRVFSSHLQTFANHDNKSEQLRTQILGGFAFLL